MPLPYLVIPLVTILVSQILKLASDGIKGTLTLRHIINDYSGMPSTHSAFVASLTTIVGIRDGITSGLFAISFVFAVIIIRDALGFRRNLGDYAARLNELTPQKPPFNTRVGHKPREVVAGCLVGFITACILSLV